MTKNLRCETTNDLRFPDQVTASFSKVPGHARIMLETGAVFSATQWHHVISVLSSPMHSSNLMANGSANARLKRLGYPTFVKNRRI